MHETAETNIGWAWRESGHNHAAEDYKALLDFMDLYFRGDEKPLGAPHGRDFQRELYPDLAEILHPGPSHGRLK